MAEIPASIQRSDGHLAVEHSGDFIPEASPIVGRDCEIEQLCGLLDLTNVRVLSLVGPGGVGKTRLAQEVMHRAGGDFAHGAVFVALASVSTPDLVPLAVAQALGVQERGDVPPDSVIATWLQSRHMLLVLDNMEHVVEAAYPWLASMIARCPRVKILVTSRIALDIAGEQRFHVSPLPVPGDNAAARLDENASVTLFIQRARGVRNDVPLDDVALQSIASICRRVDGLPLAIELAASRVHAFSPEDILSQISESLSSLAGTRRDVPARLQSLHDAVAWSYNLLPADEQVLFRRLSVFVDGFSLEAVKAVAADSVTMTGPHEVPDLIATLVDHSLVERLDGAGRTRFRMLEPIREFGMDQLAKHEELSSAWSRHAAHYLQLAQDAGGGLRGPEIATWLDLLDIEHSNVREALTWMTMNGRVAEAIDLYGSIETFFVFRALFTEARQFLERWSSHPDVEPGTRACAQVLAASAILASAMELPESPIPAYLDALAIFRKFGDRWSVMRLLDALSFVYARMSDRELAIAAHEEYMALARELGDARAEAVGFDFDALLAMQDGDLLQARAAIEASLSCARKTGDLCMVALATGDLGELVLKLDGDTGRARTLIVESRSIRERLGDKRNLPFALMQLAEIESADGNLNLAQTHLLEARTQFQHTGLAEGEINAMLARLALRQGDPVDALQFVRNALIAYSQLGKASEAAEALTLMAEVALHCGDALSAARFLGASAGLQCRSDLTPTTISSPEASQVLEERVRTGLDGGTYAKNFETGEAWTFSEALAGALSFELPRHPRRPASPCGLSPRELDVLRLMADGLSNQAIADSLFLSLRTVTSHVTAILNKLQLSSRTQAVAYAIRNGIV